MAMLFARALLRLERAGGWGARTHADDLELRLRAAAFEINTDIAEIEETVPPETEDEEIALEHLRVISLTLLGLAMFIRDLKARLTNKGAGVFVCMDGRALNAVLQSLAVRAPCAAVPFLDSG